MNLLNLIQEKKILVIGDIMLDTYFLGDVGRISPEAPVPVFRKLREKSVLGGAGNVAANVVAAGQSVGMMAIVGKDTSGTQILDELNCLGIDLDLTICVERSTPVKIRFIAGNNQQIMRLDVEETEEIAPDLCALLLKNLAECIQKYDAVVLSDYRKGLFSWDFTQGVLHMAKKLGIPTLVDVKDPVAEKYRGAWLLKPNLTELHDLTGLPVGADEEIVEAARQLRKNCECSYVLVTCGARGMVLVGDDEAHFVDSVDHEVFDVTGAGDTAVAYLTASVANGISIDRSMEIANHAAGLQVTKIGTSVISLHEVAEAVSNCGGGAAQKMLTRDAVSRLCSVRGNRRVVFTNGCFDILHAGHIHYLRKAANLGDLLIVGLNSDASVRRLKGDDRPINSESDRAAVLASLEFVDYVVLFEEDTPYELIKEIQPDVLVKGGDYSPDQVVGRDIVEANGGKLVLIDLVEGKSTTKIINHIRHEENI